MSKRCFAFTLLLVLLVFPLAARADVIVEPQDDFYAAHKDACAAHFRRYYANGDGGQVSLKKEPGSLTETGVTENGKTLTIMFTYESGGKRWGVAELGAGGLSAGWVPMDQLLLVYDSLAFCDEHKDDFYPYEGAYDALTKVESIVLWSWPGSGKIQSTLDSRKVNGSFKVTEAYRDAEGREWGFLQYFGGSRNAWILMSDPGNEAVEAFNLPPEHTFKPRVTVVPADTPGQAMQQNTKNIAHDSSRIGLIVGSVAAVAAISAVFVRLVFKRDAP